MVSFSLSYAASQSLSQPTHTSALAVICSLAVDVSPPAAAVAARRTGTVSLPLVPPLLPLLPAAVAAAAASAVIAAAAGAAITAVI